MRPLNCLVQLLRIINQTNSYYLLLILEMSHSSHKMWHFKLYNVIIIKKQKTHKHTKRQNVENDITHTHTLTKIV